MRQGRCEDHLIEPGVEACDIVGGADGLLDPPRHTAETQSQLAHQYLLADEDSLAPATRARIDAALANIDELLLDPAGLPGRAWYKNLISAPGSLTGYGAKTLPGIREGIEQRRFDDARAYVGRTAAVIEAYANRLDQVAVMGGRKTS